MLWSSCAPPSMKQFGDPLLGFFLGGVGCANLPITVYGQLHLFSPSSFLAMSSASRNALPRTVGSTGPCAVS